MPDLAKAEQAFKDLQEQGVFTQKQVDEELELSEKGVVGLCEGHVALEEAAKTAEKVATTRASSRKNLTGGTPRKVVTRPTTRPSRFLLRRPRRTTTATRTLASQPPRRRRRRPRSARGPI